MKWIEILNPTFQLSSEDFKLLLYSLFGLLIIDFTLYILYFNLPAIFPPETLRFLFKITSNGTFPFYGFYLAFLSCILPWYIGTFLLKALSKSGLKIIAHIMPSLLTLLVSLTFIPFSLTLFISYMFLIAVIIIIQIIRHLLKSEQYTQSVWNTIGGAIIAASVALAVGGFTIFWVNPAVTSMTQLGGEYWLFVQGQGALITFVITYTLGAILFWGALPCFRKA